VDSSAVAPTLGAVPSGEKQQNQDQKLDVELHDDPFVVYSPLERLRVNL
jgi:hypothetical protein